MWYRSIHELRAGLDMLDKNCRGGGGLTGPPTLPVGLNNTQGLFYYERQGRDSNSRATGTTVFPGLRYNPCSATLSFPFYYNVFSVKYLSFVFRGHSNASYEALVYS